MSHDGVETAESFVPSIARTNGGTGNGTASIGAVSAMT